MDCWELDTNDPRYPQQLLHKDFNESYGKIYGIGDVGILARPCISVIGSRAMTAYGASVCQWVARTVVDFGLTVISGGARGCDSCIAREVIQLGGKTVVVPGCGPDIVYPKSSQDVFDAAKQTAGAIVSLEAWKTPPARFRFPKRNKIIAALSQATLVVEAGMPSGTFSTADEALRLSKEVLAVPGSVFSPESKGTNWLCKQGATIICEQDDLETALFRIYGVLRKAMHCDDTKKQIAIKQDSILASLAASSFYLEDLADKLCMDALNLAKRISKYQTEGLVIQNTDGRYSLSQKGYASI